jgi:serine protease Do
LFFAPSLTRTVTALDPGEQARADQSVAVSIESAFVRVAESVGPATVSVVARAPDAPQRSARDEEEGDEERLFEDIFGNAPEARRRGMRATGSGVIVRPDGYILTNDHIVEEAIGGSVEVTLSDGSVYKGTAFRDPGTDLAVVKIDSDKPLPYVRFAEADGVQVGQWAIAIGSPFGQQNSMTAGIVSALHRRKEIRDNGRGRFYPDLIQTDASINPGNSGGPLLNIRGELIGINVAIFSPTGTSAGIGYAIPANTAKRVMEQLVTEGKVTRGWLGLVPENIPAGLRKRLGTSEGAYITSVNTGTPAAKAGIQADDVVLRIGGTPIKDEGQFRERIAGTRPGTALTMTVLRSGKTLQLTTVVGAPPQGASEEVVIPRPVVEKVDTLRTPRSLGFEPRTLNPENRERALVNSSVQGVYVPQVLRGSAASEAGLTPGSIITAINGTPVRSVESLTEAVKEAKSGDIVTLVVWQRVGENTAAQSVVNISVP